MKTYEVAADIGSVQISDGHMSLFIPNGVGDGRYKVRIVEAAADRRRLSALERDGNLVFAAYFVIVSENVAHLMDYDCQPCAPIIALAPGRYLGHHDRRGNVYIERIED